MFYRPSVNQDIFCLPLKWYKSTMAVAEKGEENVFSMNMMLGFGGYIV